MIPSNTVRRRLAELPRAPLAFLPTPLERLDSLSRDLGSVSVYVKRDDQTGLAFGGNKARKLEFIMGDMVARGADTIVTWAGVQSNWCRQVAAAAAKLGKRAVLVLLSKPGMPVGQDGNLLLDLLLRANVHLVEASGERGFLELHDVQEHVIPWVDAERREGRVPYLAPVGGSLLEGDLTRPLGAFGYVLGFAEIVEQARAQGFTPDTVLLASGSAGTQAGLLAGSKLLSPGTRIVGVSVAAPSPSVSSHVRGLTQAVLADLDAPIPLKDEDVTVLDDYLAEGYGVLNEEVASAVGLLARQEGLLLDPVYTGKAMWALLDLARRGFFREGEKIVFLHTGGTPALFPYREGLLESLGLPGSRPG